MFVLDTNIIRHAFYEPDNYPRVVANLRASNFSDIWISIVTAEELLVWRLRPLARSMATQRMPKVLETYDALAEIIGDICALQKKPFDRQVWEQFQGMPGAVGVNDRRIAATALAHDFTVVTHNTSDFEKIRTAKPLLKIVDWVETSPATPI